MRRWVVLLTADPSSSSLSLPSPLASRFDYTLPDSLTDSQAPWLVGPTPSLQIFKSVNGSPPSRSLVWRFLYPFQPVWAA